MWIRVGRGLGMTKPSRFPPLNLAVRDASSFAAAMKKAGLGQYAEVKVTEVLDDDARAAGIEWFIDRMAAAVHPRDTFVLFEQRTAYLWAAASISSRRTTTAG